MSGIVGIPGAVIAVLPRVGITTDAPLRPRDILSTPFLVTNTGPIGLRDVWVTCQVDTLATSLGQLIQNARPVERRIAGNLSPGESLTFGCVVPNWTGNILTTAGRQQLVRLSIEIRYKAWGTPFRRLHTDGFRTEPAEGGFLRWIRVEPIPIWRPDYKNR